MIRNATPVLSVSPICDSVLCQHFLSTYFNSTPTVVQFETTTPDQRLCQNSAPSAPPEASLSPRRKAPLVQASIDRFFQLLREPPRMLSPVTKRLMSTSSNTMSL